jgi:putative hemolysin
MTVDIDWTVVGLIVGSWVFVLSAAFFTISETALISSDRIHLGKLKRKGSRKAITALKHLENLDRLLMTTQFGANFSISAAATLATLGVTRAVPQYDFLIFAAFTPLILIFSDSLPKVIGRNRADSVSLQAAVPLQMVTSALFPILALLSIYTRKLSQLMGVESHDALSRRRKTREELHALLSDSDHGSSEIRLGHRRIIRKILEFNQYSVKKVMIPLVNVDAIEKSNTVREAVELFESLRHSRLPVYSERVDNIVGILHFQDVFSCRDPEETVDRYMTPTLYVPEVQQLESLTREMRAQNTSMAIVVDEYGGAVGLVTKEDVLEEIVGDISDEFDETSLTMLEISDNTYLVHVNIEISELNERLGVHLPKGEYETLSGFLLQQFNRIPSINDELFFGNLKFKVHRATERSIETVIIQTTGSEKQ